MADTRTPQDYAIEHAGYMAEAAKHLMERINEEADARGAWEDAEDDGEVELRAEILDEAVERAGEAMRHMQEAIYEFEKRRDRAVKAGASAHMGGGAAHPMRDGYTESMLVSSPELGHRLWIDYATREQADAAQAWLAGAQEVGRE